MPKQTKNQIKILNLTGETKEKLTHLSFEKGALFWPWIINTLKSAFFNENYYKTVNANQANAIEEGYSRTR